MRLLDCNYQLHAAREPGTNLYGVDHGLSDSASDAYFAIITKRKEHLLGAQIEYGIGDAKGGNALLAARIMKKLVDCYPGYYWVVGINDMVSVGVCKILNMNVNAELCCNAPYAYVLHLKELENDINLKLVMRAGGEILERANLVRGWCNGDIPTHVDGVLPKHQPRPHIFQ